MLQVNIVLCFDRRVALETLDRLTESLDFTDYASRIIHPIVRTLDGTPELRSTAMDTLSSLVFQLGKKVLANPCACFKVGDFHSSNESQCCQCSPVPWKALNGY